MDCIEFIQGLQKQGFNQKLLIYACRSEGYSDNDINLAFETLRIKQRAEQEKTIEGPIFKFLVRNLTFLILGILACSTIIGLIFFPMYRLQVVTFLRLIIPKALIYSMIFKFYFDLWGEYNENWSWFQLFSYALIIAMLLPNPTGGIINVLLLILFGFVIVIIPLMKIFKRSFSTSLLMLFALFFSSIMYDILLILI